MTPKLKGIDHVHLHFADRRAAEAWYHDVLGFVRVERLMSWAIENGPLTVEDAEGVIHLALFNREDHPKTTAIAFGATGADFLLWKEHLEGHGLNLRLADHRLAYSLYFCDPWGNQHEITTYEHDHVRAKLALQNS